MLGFEIENSYKNMTVAGIDEAGRGPLAGPVVAAAVIVNSNYLIKGVNDSKKLSKIMREKLYSEITNNYLYSTSIISPKTIDKVNILKATKKACIVAAKRLKLIVENSYIASSTIDIFLIDGNMKFIDKNFKSIIRGDSLSYSIAAASIVAKVTRDKIMTKLSKEFPQYLWYKNFGYGTKEHLKAIYELGINKHHRKSFRGVISCKIDL